MTCGPTWVPIDETRIISNTSTGELVQTLAKTLAKKKARVTVLEGPVKQPLSCSGVRVKKFTYYDELDSLIKKELKKNYNAIIHAAAVSDYKLKKALKGKISSQLQQLTLKLTPTKKIINTIRKKNPHAFLVGFKLEHRVTKQTVSRQSRVLRKKSGCDCVIVNSARKDKYSAYIIDKNSKILAHATSRKTLVQHLTHILSQHI